jgi:RimJ/RimL family protein N-acetyltransferase
MGDHRQGATRQPQTAGASGVTALIEATDAHFAWMLGEASAPDGLVLPPGGIDEPWVYGWLRRNLRALGPATSWLLVDDREVVGLCSFKSAPDEEGFAEIGYGVAPERRRLGHATRGVALLVEAASRQPHVRGLTAGTALSNAPSQRVLECNRFAQAGRGSDPDEGEMILWRRGF